jgi:hypothetical protein
MVPQNGKKIFHHRRTRRSQRSEYFLSRNFSLRSRRLGGVIFWSFLGRKSKEGRNLTGEAAKAAG